MRSETGLIYNMSPVHSAASSAAPRLVHEIDLPSWAHLQPWQHIKLIVHASSECALRGSADVVREGTGEPGAQKVRQDSQGQPASGAQHVFLL